MSATRHAQSSSGSRGGYQIGEVADRVTLSLRTTRYYAESGLLEPVGQAADGIHLYSDDAIDRLLLIKKMKPLGFNLDEMRSLVALRDELSRPGLSVERQEELAGRLRTWVVLAEEKLAMLQQQVGVAEAFVVGLHDDTHRLRRDFDL